MADRQERRIAIALAVALGGALAGCGGSGSTGLISPESALLQEVRRSGTCLTSEGVTYCATDSTEAVAPDGQSALGPNDFSGAPANPCPVGDDTCARDDTGFLVSGFDEDAACASAARRAGSEDAWAIGPLQPVGGARTQVGVFLPARLSTAAVESALLCFASPPAELPAELTTLAEASPDIIFVAPAAE
jgi:hypothetical protein